MNGRTDERLVPVVEEVIGGETYYRLHYWCHHRRGKNWVAKIVGRHPKYKFERRFLEVESFDGQKYLRSDLVSPGVYEFRHIYHTGSGYPQPSEVDGYWLFDGSNWKQLSEKDVVEYLSGNNSNVDEQTVQKILVMFEALSPVKKRELVELLSKKIEEE